jgi:hypothetical protein
LFTFLQRHSQSFEEAVNTLAVNTHCSPSSMKMPSEPAKHGQEAELADECSRTPVCAQTDIARVSIPFPQSKFKMMPGRCERNAALALCLIGLRGTVSAGP